MGPETVLTTIRKEAAVAEDVTPELLGHTLRDMQERSRRIEDRQVQDGRRENERDQLMLTTYEQVRQVDRSINELRNDLETIIKMELIGQLGVFEQRFEQRFELMAEQSRRPEGPAPGV